MIIAGYISATTVDLVRTERVKGEIRLYSTKHFPTAEHSDLDSILTMYLEKIREPIKVACFGVAGPVINDEVRTTNLPWHIIADESRKKFSIGKVKLVNDLVATARGLFHLKSSKLISINSGAGSSVGQIGLLAAGNGLGQSLIYRDGDEIFPYASEGGHGDFAPANQIEVDLWEFIYSQKGHVEIEDVISLGGLVNIFDFLKDRKNQETPDWYQTAEDRPAAIIEMALAGKDDDANVALEILVDCLASEAANLALKGMTLGGVYLGGILTKQIMTAIDKPRFMERFVKKGKMESLLEQIPVSLIIDDNTALLGAAAIALDEAGE